MSKRYALLDAQWERIKDLRARPPAQRWRKRGDREKQALKQPREYDRHLYQARHLIENFFAKLKQYRGIATRYDKTARNFLGAIHLAATVVWLA